MRGTYAGSFGASTASQGGSSEISSSSSPSIGIWSVAGGEEQASVCGGENWVDVEQRGHLNTAFLASEIEGNPEQERWHHAGQKSQPTKEFPGKSQTGS